MLYMENSRFKYRVEFLYFFEFYWEFHYKKRFTFKYNKFQFIIHFNLLDPVPRTTKMDIFCISRFHLVKMILVNNFEEHHQFSTLWLNMDNYHEGLLTPAELCLSFHQRFVLKLLLHLISVEFLDHHLCVSNHKLLHLTTARWVKLEGHQYFQFHLKHYCW